MRLNPAKANSPGDLPGVLVLLFCFAFPCLSVGQSLVLKSDEFKFIWPVPSSWESTQSFTKGQYALKRKGEKLMTLVLLAYPADKMTLSRLLALHAADPQYLFRGIRTRFPESSFIGSSVVKIGSHDAIQTQAQYVTKNLDTTITIFMCSHTTIWRGIAYTIAFECLPEHRAEGLAEMAAALTAFSFAE